MSIHIETKDFTDETQVIIRINGNKEQLTHKQFMDFYSKVMKIKLDIDKRKRLKDYSDVMKAYTHVKNPNQKITFGEHP